MFVEALIYKPIQFISVNGFYSWPCFMQGRTFFNDRADAEVSFPSAYQILVSSEKGEEDGECLQINGPYILYRYKLHELI